MHIKKIFSCLFLLIVFCSIASIGANAETGRISNIDIDPSSPFIHPDFTKKISMDFQEARLIDVLKIFSKQSDLNMITSANLADYLVTVYLDNVPIDQALEQILRANDLTYELQPNTDIYIVKPLQKPEVELVTRVYKLKHASVNSAIIKNTLTLRDSDGEEIGESDDEDGGGDSEGGSGILAVVAGLITPLGQVVEDPRTNSLIITDIASNFPNIENAISKMDISVPQILIEVEMLEVAKQVSDKIGVKISDTVVAFQGANRATTYPWDPNQLQDKGYISQSDIEYTLGSVSTSGFTAVLNFLKSHSDTKTLARPRIMTLNNEPAQIKIATDEAIGVQTETTSSNAIATSAEKAERVETGVFLTVTPQANIESGEITMALDPKVIVARTGATYAGTTFRDPEERGSKAVLRVQNGDTIIMGGLLRTEEAKTITKVPFFGDLPLIGSAFRHREEVVTERELIIFITPHIIDETPPERTAVINPQKILSEREQDNQNNRFKEIEKELTVRIDN